MTVKIHLANLVNINALIKFGQILSVCSQDIERKLSSSINKSRPITLVQMCGK